MGIKIINFTGNTLQQFLERSLLIAKSMCLTESGIEDYCGSMLEHPMLVSLSLTKKS